MENNKLDLIKLLDYIDPSMLDYQEWLNVGMALKSEVYTASDWDIWSKRDNRRYNPDECFKKWNTFESSSITGATITQIAKDNGWEPRKKTNHHELDWDDEVGGDEYVIIDKNWIEGMEIQEPTEWNPVKELT